VARTNKRKLCGYLVAGGSLLRIPHRLAVKIGTKPRFGDVAFSCENENCSFSGAFNCAHGHEMVFFPFYSLILLQNPFKQFYPAQLRQNLLYLICV